MVKIESIKMLKKKMIDVGVTTFVKYLSEVLNISTASASKKLNGQSQFKQREIIILTEKLDLSGEEVKEIFAGGGEDAE